MLQHLPNAITASRGLAGIAVAWLLLQDDPHHLAFYVFVAAMLTDLVDGALARTLNATGELGRWLDPISDKMLTNLVWLALFAVGWVTPWIALPLVLRDIIIGVSYTLAHHYKRRFDINHAGRVAVSMEGAALSILVFHGPWLDVDWQAIGTGVGAVTVALSVVAAGQYLAQGPQLIR